MKFFDFSLPKRKNYRTTDRWIQELLRYPKNSYYQLVEIFQRGTRGYSDGDIWSLNHYLAQWIPSAVRTLKDGYTWPGISALGICTWEEELEAQYWNYPELEQDEKKKEYYQLEQLSLDKWNDILEKIALAFEAQAKIEEMEGHDRFYSNSPEEISILRRKKYSNEHNRVVRDEEVGLHFDQEGWDRYQEELKEQARVGMELFVQYFMALND